MNNKLLERIKSFQITDDDIELLNIIATDLHKYDEELNNNKWLLIPTEFKLPFMEEISYYLSWKKGIRKNGFQICLVLKLGCNVLLDKPLTEVKKELRLKCYPYLDEFIEKILDNADIRTYKMKIAHRISHNSYL